MVSIPDTRYARTSDGVYLAYRAIGEGPIDMICQFDWMGNVDVLLDTEPTTIGMVGAFAGYTRLIFFDRRGTGLSSRNVPPPNLETAVGDCRAVLDELGIEQPALFGFHAGGSAQALFAATHPERVRAMVWYNPAARSTWAPDYPWGVGPEYVERSERAILEGWGTSEYGPAFNAAERIPGTKAHLSDDPDEMLGMLSRHTATPDVALQMQRNWYDTDVRAVLPSVNVPTLLFSHGREHAQAEYIASLLPHADLITVTSDRDRPAPRDAAAVLDPIREWLGAPVPVDDGGSVLATVLFTDIVNSTAIAAARGDHGWARLVEQHHAIVRAELSRWRGVENDTAGDGFFATFDGPARAIRCALEVVERVRELDIEIRAGVHTGECTMIDGKVGGLAVSIGARVMATSGASEVRASQTVKDLTAGSGFFYDDVGEYELKGVPDRWRLYRVVRERN
jgi:class 3 adenylate cyclase